jgi:hypothetical protein
MGAATGARADELAEYQVKVAFLYNFAKFVEWPDRVFTGPAAPMSFCVMGDDPFGDALDSIKGKTVKERKVAVKRISDISDAGSCHVLFISSSEDGRLEEIISTLGQGPVLLVGDMDRFARRGGMIKFRVENNKVAFEINAGTAKGAGLKISSQLLKLARTVIE